jgi:hypothetical protein
MRIESNARSAVPIGASAVTDGLQDFLVANVQPVKRSDGNSRASRISEMR